MRTQQCLLTHSIPVSQFPTQEIESGQCPLNMNSSRYCLMQERQSYKAKNNDWWI